MLSRLETVKKWRWDLIVVGAATLLFWAVTTSPNAYFIQSDTPAQDSMALAWTYNCWEYITEKLLSVVLLAPLFKLFGPSPHWETLLLMLMASISVAVIYELACLVGNSKLTGALTALFLVALPAFQFFSRTYLGYITPFLLLGWLAVFHKRWGWAGIWFGLAFTAHFMSVVSIGIFTLALFIFNLRHESWKQWLAFCLGGLAPLAVIEGLYFFYLGHVYAFVWIRSIFTVTWKSTTYSAFHTSPKWLWLIETVSHSNGLLVSVLLAVGLLSPFVFRHNKTALALSVSSIALAAFHLIQAGLGRSLVLPRLLAPAYPFWAFCAAATLAWTINSRPQQTLRQIALGLSFFTFGVLGVQNGLFMRQFTQTLYPQVEQWMLRAEAEGRSVRYEGNSWVALFYARIHGVEILVNDERWIKANAPGQAVLIFANGAPDTISHDGYTISSIGMDSATDGKYPALTYEANIPRRFELWWPDRANDSLEPSTPPNAGFAAFYYPGYGCIIPPAYNNGNQPRTLHYYQLAWKKLVSFFK